MTAYATEIRDAALVLLTATAVAAGKPYARTRTNWGWQLEPDKDFPALSVFVPRETLTAEGDGNAGEPSFVNDVTLGVIISLGYKAPEDLDLDGSARVNTALDTLLTTPSFLRMFESVERVEQGTVFDKDGETFISEFTLNVTVRFRTDWPPNVPDNFESVSVTSRPLGKDAKTPPTILTINVPPGVTMRIAVEPVSPDVAVPPHPIDGPMYPEGMEWTADQYTFRLIQDEVIRRKADPEPGPAPIVPAAPAPTGGAKPIPQTAIAKPAVASPAPEKV